MDVFETQGRVAIFVALPGVEAGDVDVFIDGDTVIVTGTRPLPRMDGACSSTAWRFRMGASSGRYAWHRRQDWS